jgi:uncharacterized membrane protein
MTVADILPVTTSRSSRWLLLGSLALNLFFVGIAVAMAIRAPAPPSWDRNVFVRVERIAGTLPPADADLLRGVVNGGKQTLEATQNDYRTAQHQIRLVLRQEPFAVDGLRAAMAKTRATRQTFDQTLQGLFADAAARMSPAGRQALADWPPGRKSASKP